MNLQEQHMQKADVGAVSLAALSFFKAIPWPEIAAFLAAVYTFCRLVGWLITTVKGWRK